MEEKEYAINGMRCMGCLNKIKNQLNSHNEISEISINLKTSVAKIRFKNLVETTALQLLLKSIGDYEIKEIFSTSNNNKERILVTYKPLILIISFITIVTFISSYELEFDANLWMRHFMGGFFIVFSFFKFLDIKGFQKNFSGYDIVAKNWKSYGFIYPFIELFLGFLYLLNLIPLTTNVLTLIILSIGTIGVVRSVIFKKKIECACLGTIFNLPMSKITIIENSTMIIMASYKIIEFTIF